MGWKQKEKAGATQLFLKTIRNAVLRIAFRHYLKATLPAPGRHIGVNRGARNCCGNIGGLAEFDLAARILGPHPLGEKRRSDHSNRSERNTKGCMKYSRNQRRLTRRSHRASQLSLRSRQARCSTTIDRVRNSRCGPFANCVTPGHPDTHRDDGENSKNYGYPFNHTLILLSFKTFPVLRPGTITKIEPF